MVKPSTIVQNDATIYGKKESNQINKQLWTF